MDYPPPNHAPPSADLASILATLAAYTPAPAPVPAPVPAPTVPTTVHTPPTLEEGEYDPSTLDTSISSTQFVQVEQQSKPLQRPPPSSIIPNEQHHQHRQQKQKSPSAVPSSSTITTWPPALRYVTKFIATNEAAMHRIRHLIQTQHEHERQWWEGRVSLVTQQAGREEGRRKLNSVLASVGGRIHPVADKDSSESNTHELVLYDRKVHIACTAMIKSHTSELFRLGVPFFNTSPELVMVGDEAEGEDDRKGALIRIKEIELKKLREKMIHLMEDLCSE